MTTTDQREAVARKLWQRRLDNDDPDTHSVAWEDAIASPNVAIAYEVQEIRRDAETAIAALLPDRANGVAPGTSDDAGEERP